MNKKKNQLVRINVVFMTLVYLVFAYSCNSKSTPEGIMTIDVTKSYPEKVIDLKDIADVSYVIMNDSDGFLYRGGPRCITDNTIVIEDYATNDFLFFTRDGTPKSRFNCIGGGPKECSYIGSLIYDENKDELFIVSVDKVLVYSSEGKFIRKFSLLGNYGRVIRDFDDKCLMMYDKMECYDTDFLLISKEDGSVMDLIDLPRNKKVQVYLSVVKGSNIMVTKARTNNIVSYKDGFLLTNYSSDTVYWYNRNKELEPFLARTPEIQKMNPIVYLNSLVECSEYQFMQVITVKNENGRFPQVCLVRDKKNNKIYTQKIKVSEFKGKTLTITPTCLKRMKGADIGLFKFNLDELQTANSEHKLSGELKRITEYAERTNNSNNIYMFAQFK